MGEEWLFGFRGIPGLQNRETWGTRRLRKNERKTETSLGECYPTLAPEKGARMGHGVVEVSQVSKIGRPGAPYVGGETRFPKRGVSGSELAALCAIAS